MKLSMPIEKQWKYCEYSYRILLLLWPLICNYIREIRMRIPTYNNRMNWNIKRQTCTWNEKRSMQLVIKFISNSIGRLLIHPVSRQITRGVWSSDYGGLESQVRNLGLRPTPDSGQVRTSPNFLCRQTGNLGPDRTGKLGLRTRILTLGPPEQPRTGPGWETYDLGLSPNFRAASETT